MPASALSWKAIPAVTTSTMTGAGWLTALKSVFDSPSYIGGAARNPLTSWSTETLAADGSLKLTAPNNPHGLIAHFVQNAYSTSTPKSFGEVNTSNGSGKVLGTIVLNPGTYASNTATPWGASARCFGYCHMSPMYVPSKPYPTLTELNNAGLGMSNGGAGNTITSVTVRAWESTDAIVIHVNTNLGIGALYVLGGWLAPDQLITEQSEAESDGVLYGIMTSGNCSGFMSDANYNFFRNAADSHPTVLYSAGTSAAFTGNIYNLSIPNSPLGGDTPGRILIAYPHCGVLSPGTSNIIHVNRIGAYRFVGPETTASYLYPTKLNTISGKFIKLPMYFTTAYDYKGTSLPTNPSFMGRAREMWMFRRALNGLALTDGGAGGQIKGYIVSFSDTVSGDAMILTV